MRVLGDKIFVKILKEDRENLFRKKIRRDDGTECYLFLPDLSGTTSSNHVFYVQTGVVVGVGNKVQGIKEGDIAILDHQVSNMTHNLVYKDDDGDVYWINATTTYHTTNQVAYANRRSPKDQIVHKKGDYDEISMLLGIIRGNEILARTPYIFLHHEDSEINLLTTSGIIYKQRQELLKRKIMAVSRDTYERLGVDVNDTILVNDRDIFMVELNGRKLNALMDVDVIHRVN